MTSMPKYNYLAIKPEHNDKYFAITIKPGDDNEYAMMAVFQAGMGQHMCRDGNKAGQVRRKRHIIVQVALAIKPERDNLCNLVQRNKLTERRVSNNRAPN